MDKIKYKSAKAGPRLLLVDGHAAFRQPLARVLESELDLAGIVEAGSLADAREVATPVDICALELDLPDGSGLDLIPQLLMRHGRVAVLILTSVEDELLLARAVEAGAAGLLHKTCALADVLEAVRRLARGERLIDVRQMTRLVELARAHRSQQHDVGRRISSLTARERDVLQALAEGLSDKEVAGRLQISVDTVRTHLVNVFGKLNVESRLQAVLFALRHGVSQLA